MRLLAWIDGRVVEASALHHDTPFVMQRVHTLSHAIYRIEEHLEILRYDSERLFGFASLCSVADAQEIISLLLDKSRVSTTLSCPITIRLNCRGELSFTVETPTFGSGIYLRAKRFEGVVYEANKSSTLTQTSASVAYDDFLDRCVRMFGGEKAVLVDKSLNVISRPWLPIFVAHRTKVYTPEEFNSVEYRLAKDAIMRAGFELVVRDIPAGSLDQIDEIFMVDIMSVTALSKIGNHRLLTTVSTRVTKKMEL
ncbi:MAG: hypothetical protein J6R90_00420 [Alistipes sp.]|nr:hypothetical protein [Alistipes sp.]